MLEKYVLKNVRMNLQQCLLTIPLFPVVFCFPTRTRQSMNVLLTLYERATDHRFHKAFHVGEDTSFVAYPTAATMLGPVLRLLVACVKYEPKLFELNHDPTSQSRYATAICSMFTLLIRIYVHLQAQHSHPPSSINFFTPSLTFTYPCSHDTSIIYAAVALRPRLPPTTMPAISQSNHAPASIGTTPLPTHTMSTDVCTDPEHTRHGRPETYMCRHKMQQTDIGRGYP
jgi:hypothetical protein